MDELTPRLTPAAPTAGPTPGAAFMARVRLTTKAGAVLAEPGDSCDRVPASSLPWLAVQGLIVPRI